MNTQQQGLSSLTLFNKLVNIINNEEKLTINENDEMITGGVLLNETIDNLVGGNQQRLAVGESMKQTPTPITKELNENLFEGGNQQPPTDGENTSENKEEDTTSENNEDDYTMFLHRLKTKQLFTQSPIIGGNSKGEPQQITTRENDIDVLPMFPYLVRY